MPDTTEDDSPRPWWRRLAWFALLYLAGLAAFGGVVMLARALLKAITPS